LSDDGPIRSTGKSKMWDQDCRVVRRGEPLAIQAFPAVPLTVADLLG